MIRVRVAVVGAGFAGVAMARRLAAAGESFVVLERRPGIGGTWHDNRYPGVACDVPAHLYGYSDIAHPGFSRVFAPGAEILEYLQDAAAPVADRIMLSTRLESADWDGDAWQLTTSRGRVEAEVLVMAAGRLTEPRLPEVPGTFDGPVVHTARWDDDLDLDGARVAVVGTGASGIQIVPELARRAESVVVLQRSAPFILPKGDRAYAEAEIALFERQPDRLAGLRADLMRETEEVFAQRAGDGRAEARGRALGHLASQVPDPVLRAALTPDHEFGCKRVLFSDDYYSTLRMPHVRHVPGALTAYEPRAVVAADRSRHEVDVVVAATGFHTTRQPYAELIRGRGGISLDQYWSQGMRAYASTAVHGFPNLFVLDGPNATLAHNSAVLMIEAQADYVASALPWTAHGPLEVSFEAEQRYVDELQERSTVWISGCHNWYVDERSGRQVLLWPGKAQEFRDRFGSFDPAPFGVVESAGA
ncbi:NAD(P)-binding protein [Aeromicrobium sp. 636]|uniref:NAD(P)/FAD-dependent oxidoreductase n=1 Tax=Aeromicrobium senzhongii TaxID=2663859 RepID=A0A8I0EVY2_9ACTN|nr:MULTISPECIES: NAD(P)/FAD-dependent oxidoreductase [Aeromicrobium]MBC9226332.1 NAD(P)/FAD-dependent oxidoreductase [Aeromicrobium senzhongii]MCQ3998437.1 NAD(P)-binding protein [Aeromicrobium sp. 636]MTB88864.1 NAD(P)-binding protein [Aeromicrobium senzhongii]QNL93850.1 NAD(P)/FAD-dependent oxidoreductase [Aeromicrobium senzhongii]